MDDQFLAKARAVAAELRKRAHLAKAIDNSGQPLVLIAVASSLTAEISSATVGIIPYDMGLAHRQSMTPEQIVDEIVGIEAKLTIPWAHDHVKP